MMESASVQRTKAVLFPVLLVVATLYFAREFFMPLALAILIAFLLAPIVRKLEKWHCGRIGSVITVAFLAFAALGGLATIVGGQLIDLANRLPEYKTELHEKIQSFKAPKDGAIKRATDTIKDLATDLNESDAAAAPTPGRQAKTGEVSPKTDEPMGSVKINPLPQSPSTPTPVTIVTARNSLETVLDIVRPIAAPLGTAAIVIVFVIFMLLGREDLRDRIIHLIGRGHLQETTQALDDAGHRVSRYLLAQLVVNTLYGIPIAVGLYFLKVPNAVLWGLLATLLRFIPYIGAWIASGFPIALSMAVANGWTTPLLTIALFVVVELITNNVLEPWLYGTSTGMSALAVIVAAAFWTWLWGMPGLLLATPLTVCIAVLGKYIPSLAWMDVLLGDRPPIAAEDRFYQRLLAADEDEVADIATKFHAEHTLASTFDELIIPAIRLADEDFHRGLLTDDRRQVLLDQVDLILKDLGVPEGELSSSKDPKEADDEGAAVIIPACDSADEIAGAMLCRLLAVGGISAHLISSRALASEMIAEAEKYPAHLFCISVTPPGASRHVTYMTKRLRERFPDCRIIVGIWGEKEGSHRLQRYSREKLDGVVSSLEQAARYFQATASSVNVKAEQVASADASE